MTLVDTSTWIDHFRHTNPALRTALTDGQVSLLHPFVIGELMLGTLPQRSMTLRLLSTLPCLVPSTHADVVAAVIPSVFTEVSPPVAAIPSLG